MDWQLLQKASKTKAEFYPSCLEESTPTPNNQLKVSKMGYYAFVADIYGEGNYQKTHKSRKTSWILQK
jgi:hypothetical protein